MDKLREIKTFLTDVLSADPSHILQHVDEQKLVTLHEYRKLQIFSISAPLLDTHTSKDGETCSKFLALLQQPDIRTPFPRLKKSKRLRCNALLLNHGYTSSNKIHKNFEAQPYRSIYGMVFGGMTWLYDCSC
uniref:Uncharacterized protein n=1 Tax=Oncorhynchus tshawytscha TaxID=74940 RepID=A0A8C8C0X3_ONCTS